MRVRPIAIVTLLALAACRSASVPPPAPPPPPPRDDPDRGAVFAKLVPDPNAPSINLGPDEEYISPQIMPGNPLPEYPPDLVPLRLPPHTIVVRFIANERSRVEQIIPSPLGGTTDDAYCPRFEESVHAALANWRVYPARIRKLRPGPDSDGDGKPDYRIMIAQKTLKSFFDISFVFEVVDGKGVVRSSNASP